MAWPTTKATTTHLDAGTDDPNQARPEIKQNIDNVNSIIDFFPGGVIDLGNQTVVIEFSGGALSSGYNVITEHYDGGSLCTVSGGNSFTLASGTYIMQHEAIFITPDTAAMSFYNVTATSDVVASNPVEIGTTNQSVAMGLNNTVFTSNGTDSYAFKYLTYTPSNSADSRDGLRVRFTKIA
jgi:hypothetical protein